MSHAPESSGLDKIAERVDQAVAEIQGLGRESREKALALKTVVEEFHKAGLTRIVQRLKTDPRGKELLLELAEDPTVYALFSLHGLVKADFATRVSRAVESLRPYLRMQGGDAELAEIAGEAVRIRVAGACAGASAAAQALRAGAEEALKYNIAEIRSIEWIDPAELAQLVQLEPLMKSAAPQWVHGPAVDSLERGKPYRLDQGDASVILILLGGDVRAFRNQCAHLGLPLDGGRVDPEAGTITCPWHGYRYDCASGECLTAPQAPLEAVPVRIENGIVQVRRL